MKVLVMNGSPRGEHSNTLRLTLAFLEGMKQNGSVETEILPVYQMDIKPCLGCFSCWKQTPGACCLHDDMEPVIEKIVKADVVIWSFPLYYFGFPSKLKALMDRRLPMVLPFMQNRPDGRGRGSHPARYDLSRQRTVLISTCGFYSPEQNYDAVLRQFELSGCRMDQLTTLFCGQGELFRIPQVRKRTDEYLLHVKAAGAEYAKNGIISEPTREKLEELLYPREVFEPMANESWGVPIPESLQNRGTVAMEASVQPADASLIFTSQMACLYDPASWDGQDCVLEMHYTDLDKTYQIVLSEGRHTVKTTEFLPYTTRIETPYSVWCSISAGEISGEDALMKHQYRVLGDFSLLINWDSVFGFKSRKTSPPEHPQKKTAEPKKQMALLTAPWIAVWILLPISAFWGGVAGILFSAATPLAYFRWRATGYEFASIFLASVTSLLALLGFPLRAVVPLSYLGFGILWIVSGFFKVPLTARYSMQDYGGESALNNALFIRTNRLLTFTWGILYLITPIWTYFIMGTSFVYLTGLINSVTPALMGLFTMWFKDWYPAKLAMGHSEHTAKEKLEQINV